MDAESAHALMRVQVAMWLGDDWCRCLFCGHVYDSVDDFLEREPVLVNRAPDGTMRIADSVCWHAAGQPGAE